VNKAAKAGVQLLKQENSAYKIKEEIAQRAKPQGKLTKEYYNA
jgi:hypothetical protein